MIIETEGLTKRFGRKLALSGLDLSVPRGAAMAMVGANGAGKTTALRTLLNIYRPTAGTARVMGADSRKLGCRDFQRIGFVSENQKLPGALTVDQFFDYLRPLYDKWDRELEDRLRREFDLPADRKIRSLSHGMRMKAALASALPFHPELLVLDEPLSGLDPLVRDEVVEGVLTQAEDMTILISSHELSEIEGFATHIAFIEDGKLKFQEAMDDLRLRFREVTVQFAAPVETPKLSSPDWLSVKSEGSTLRFIDSHFTSEAALRAQIADRAGAPKSVDIAPLSLREISKALMKEARKGRGK